MMLHHKYLLSSLVFVLLFMTGCATTSSLQKSATPSATFSTRLNIEEVRSIVPRIASHHGLFVSGQQSPNEFRFKNNSYSTGPFLCSGNLIGVFLGKSNYGTKVKIIEKLRLATQVVGCKEMAAPLRSALEIESSAQLRRISNSMTTNQPTKQSNVKSAGTSIAMGPKDSIAVLPLKGKQIAVEYMDTLNDLLTHMVAEQSGVEVIGYSDIDAMLQRQATLDDLGCNDIVCAAEIGGALGVRYLVYGKVSYLDSQMIIGLSLLDTKTQKVIRRGRAMSTTDKPKLTKIMLQSVEALFQ